MKWLFFGFLKKHQNKLFVAKLLNYNTNIDFRIIALILKSRDTDKKEALVEELL